MEVENCFESRSWEEDIYWNHFQFIHFSLTLNSGFDQQLAIPEHFSKNLRKKLPEIVVLKGPSGGLWEVRVTVDDAVMFFKHGWNDFVKDHSLKVKDLLVFKYNGDSQFDVLVFDGESSCERASAYFVRKVPPIESSSGCHEKRKIGENSGEGSRQDVNPSPSREKSADNNIVDTSPLERPVKSKGSSKKPRKLTKPSAPSWDWHVLENGQLNVEENQQHSLNVEENQQHSFVDEEIETKPDLLNMCLSASPVYDVPYISSKRLVTEEEKQNALQSALKASSDSGFIQVMKPTSVLRKFYMVIPSGWMTRHLKNLQEDDVILRINENIWRTKFVYQKSRNSGGLSSGWRNFVTDNNLQEFDVLVFEPGSPINNSIVLDVQIFRVLP